MATLKVGIIGAGMIAPSGIDGFRKAKDVEVVAIADTSEVRRMARAKEYDIPTTYTTAAELIADKNIDIIYVALPNKFHVPVSIAGLEAGKHVFSEKPMAMNLAEALEVQRVMKVTQKQYMVGMNQRFALDSQKIKALTDKKFFGELYHAKAYWNRRSGSPKQGTWFGNDPLAGGGCILDIGVHMLDLGLYLLENFQAEAVSGVTYTKFGNRGLGFGGWGMSDDEKLPFTVDDFACALIKLKGGQTVQLDVSWACHNESDRNNVELYGTEAGAKCYPAKVFYFNKELASTVNVELKDSDTREGAYASNPIRYPHQDRFVNFVKALRGEEELCCKIEESINVQKILDAVKESSRTGKEVRL